MIELIIEVAAFVFIAWYSTNVGKLIERIRVYSILNNTVDALDEISEKPAQYRLGYLAALDKVGQGVHKK